MTPIIVPTQDVNSERGVIVVWRAKDRTEVLAGQSVAEVETTKAIIEVTASEAGILRWAHPEGAEVELSEPIGHIYADLEALEASASSKEEAPSPSSVRATVKAKARAEALGVDLADLPQDRLITVKLVEAAHRASTSVSAPTLEPLAGLEGVERVMIIGGGRGATQVIDIFRTGGERQMAVAIVDDDDNKWGHSVCGVPVVGETDRLQNLFANGTFDAAIIAISTSVEARRKLRRRCEDLGIPLTNAIDVTSKIATEVTLGKGNVICAFCHIGTSTIVGDNNFLSAYNSFDHHNVLGRDISTGPSVATSSRVKIGDRVRLGTGIVMQPGVELGEGVQVASGAVIVKSVPAHHAVKTKIVTTEVRKIDDRQSLVDAGQISGCQK